MNKIPLLLKRYLYDDTWFTTKFLWYWYLHHNLWFLFKWGNYHEFFDPWTFFVHFLGLIYIYCYSEFFNKLLKKNYSRILVSILLSVLYFILAKYRYRTHSGFDYSIVHDNFYEIFNWNAMQVAAGTFKPKDIFQALALIPVLIFVQKKYLSFTKNVLTNYKLAASYAVVLLIMLVTTPIPYGEISYTLKTAYEFHFEGLPQTPLYNELVAKEKPFVKNFKSSLMLNKKPNIFVLNIESFNALQIEKKAGNGKMITPIFNELIKEGIYIDDFYGNSIQTIKGQFAFLCSRIPLIKGKASYDIEDMPLGTLDCLPRVLANHGYETLFHKCYSDMSFDDTGNFMKKIGFQNIEHTNRSGISKKHIWGWGVQDNFSYKQYLDNVEKVAKKGKPVFAFIHTVSHHMKFDAVPDHQSYLFDMKAPRNRKDRFSNSLHATDKYIGSFIEDLKSRGLYEDSLIIITGDHSFPAGEHFLFSNETGYYQEFFRTPFLMIWKNQFEPERIKKRTYSHIDIAPTLLDILGIEGEFNMMGNSIFQTKSNYAHLVQPYNGVYLSIVKWPYKYVWERRSKRDFLFNLEEDPEEKNSLNLENIINEYKNQIGKTIYSHEKLYRTGNK